MGLCLLLACTLHAQKSDDFFLEDLFYTGVTYNVLTNKPGDVIQRSLSYTINAGAFREWALTSNRKLSVAQGVGYSLSAYYSNIGAEQSGNQITYRILDNSEYRRSKIGAHAVEFPFEIRFRGTSPENYRFWRFHAGITYSYVFDSHWVRVDDDGRSRIRNTDMRKSQWGLTSSIGYNTFNFRLYYGLTPLLNDDPRINGEPVALRNFGIGIYFYIL